MDQKLESAIELIRLMPDEEQDRIALQLLDYIAWLERPEKEDEKAS